MKARSFLLLLATVAIMFSCEKDDNKPTPVNEEELITTLILDFVDQNTMDTVRFSFVDLDGDGGNAPVITNSTLSDSSDYLVYVSFFNETENPAEDITLEVIDEGDEHQVFYLIANNLEMTMAYANTPRNLDANGRPIGVEANATTLGVSNGTLTVVLRHEPNKSASGVSQGDITNAGGETDIEVVFQVEVI